VVAQDPERLARFDREAKLLASLNHANIAAVYGLHEQGDLRFLAMELVPGEDLSGHLRRGRIPVSDALRIAQQVADALQSAHESGVVHRDLKPGNIVITPEGRAKVLDFGLAKAFEADPSAPVSPTLSPTLTSTGTLPGVILGTAAYMSPEQARGEPVDKRADVWAFGCVLFEMLTGRMIFKEKTISDTLASVLKVEPDWNLLPADVQDSIRRLLMRCLEKQPRQRLHDIADARIEIEATLADPHAANSSVAAAAGAARPRPRPAITAVLLLLATVVGLLVGRLLAPAVPEQRVRRFVVPVAAKLGQLPLSTPVISPDGRAIVYVFDGMLWLRDLDQVEPRRLEATAGAGAPFWSPDSSHIGYRVDQTLWRMATAGGQPTPICDGAPDIFPGSWGPDGTIVFSKLTEIFEVPARGGEPKVLLERDETQEHHFHEAVWLPDGSGLLLVRHRETGKPADAITLWSDGRRTDLLTLESTGVADPRYSPSGHILFTREGDNPGVWALPFSLSRLEVTGEPFLVVPDAGEASASADGTLVYRGDRTGRDVELVWFDAEGKVLEAIGRPQQDMSDPALSPDGTRIAVAAKEGNEWDIWIHDLEGNRQRLTFERGRESRPRWSPDGSRLFFHHPHEGDSSIYSVASDGSEEPRRLAEGLDVSVDPGGGRIVFSRAGQDTSSDLWWLSLDDGQPVPFLQTPAIEEAPALSRDGRFLAYVSMEPEAEPHVYIRPFPEGSGEWQVANEHGYQPYWSPAGDRLYFNSNVSLREVEVSTDPVLRLGTPRLMIDAQRTELQLWRGISASADGTRFVGIRPARDGGDAMYGIHVMESWLSEFGD